MKTRTIAFDVDGTPKGQPRPRAFSRNGHARVFDPGTAEGWKSAIAIAARPHLPPEPVAGPVCLNVQFRMPRPARLSRKKDPDDAIRCTAKPDLDNLAKAVMDALTQIGMWKDDAQVTGTTLTKVYHAKTGRPGATIEIQVLEV